MIGAITLWMIIPLKIFRKVNSICKCDGNHALHTLPSTKLINESMRHDAVMRIFRSKLKWTVLIINIYWSHSRFVITPARRKLNRCIRFSVMSTGSYDGSNLITNNCNLSQPVWRFVCIFKRGNLIVFYCGLVQIISPIFVRANSGH